MELYLRVRDPSRSSTEEVDVVVDADATHTVADLCQCFGRPTLTVTRTGRRLHPDTPLADADLRSGDQIVCTGRTPERVRPVRSSPQPGRSRRSSATVDVDIIGGNDTATTVALGPGRWSLGRSRLATIRVTDPAVSRHHLDLVVGAGSDVSVALTPTSANPSVLSVDGDVIDPGVESTPLQHGAVVAVGATRFVVRPHVRPPADAAPTAGGHDFHRTPYRPPSVITTDAEPIGPIPDRPQQRRFGVLAALAPLAAGLALFAFTRQVMFLALTLVSPIVMIGGTIEDRRSGRRSFARQLDEFHLRLDHQVDHLAEQRADERAIRHAAAPDLALLARRARHRSPDLWARSATCPDALRVRIGLGTDRVAFPLTLTAGGADDLREHAERVIAPLRTLADIPILVDLLTDPVLAVCGPAPRAERLVGAIIAQLSCLHSPDDVVMALAVAPARHLDWCAWLPHRRSGVSPIGGSHLAATTAEADRLLHALVDVADQRGPTPHDRSEPWPRIVAVVDATLRPDPALVARVLDRRWGLTVIWLADELATVPRHADRVIEVGADELDATVATTWATDPGTPRRTITAEQLHPSHGDAIARSLAPIRDASSSSAGASLPTVVPLLDVVSADADHIEQRWRTDSGYRLDFPLGMGPTGPISVDLVGDGPHTLIGGTSGAGKSELLQSMVAGLAASSPPTAVNFLFVDYKGGASTQIFERLPHTVGSVTNLSGDLADRALVSLRAELDRRMALLEGRARDLAELLTVDPTSAPPSLVIVVDEFATLVREVPDFMAGVVDVAQRGRSLGIHLVLATQRPSGSIDENILANTNLRISLRMLDRADSTAVLGVPDAAEIPVPLRGRGIVSRGPRSLVEFQSPWATAPLPDQLATDRPIRIAPFGFGVTPRAVAGATPGITGPGSAGESSQVDAVIDAVAAAWERFDLPLPRRPWRDPLADHVELADLLDELALGSASAPSAPSPRRAPTSAVVGRCDEPSLQRQDPAVIDLTDGAVMLVGAPGTGATAFVRTLVASLAPAATPSAPVSVVVVDMGGDLADLADHPAVADVVAGDDLEGITRQLIALDDLVGRRRANRSFESGPAVVVVIDGMDAFADALLDPGASRDAERWIDTLSRLVLDGRAAGVHLVLTATRRAALPSRLHAAVAHRLVLRQLDENAYSDLGIPARMASALDAAPGRCLLDGGVVVQLAVASNVADLVQTAPSATSLSRRLPDELHLADLVDLVDLDASRPAMDRSRIVLGVSDVYGATTTVDLTWDDLVVFGPARSGRTSALGTVAAQLDERSLVIGGRRSTRLDASELVDAFDRVLESADPAAIVIDDADTLDDPILVPALDRVARRDDLCLVASLDTRSMTGYSTNPLVARLRRARQLIALQPDPGPDVAQLLGAPFRARPGLRLPPGRGAVSTGSVVTTIHLALPPLQLGTVAVGDSPQLQRSSGEPCDALDQLAEGRVGGQTLTSAGPP